VLNLWWQIPGPYAFLKQVLEDLRAGNHVILLLPEHGPQNIGLFSAFSQAWKKEGLGPLDRIWTARNLSPRRILAERYNLKRGSNLL
jgi:hypothetical protein